MTPRTRFTAAVVAAGLLAAACGSDDAASPSPEAAPPSDAPTDTATSDTAVPDTAADDTGPAATAGEPTEEVADITLVAYESFPTEGEIVDQLDAFTAQTGIGIDILIAGDTGTMLAKAELTAGNPEGDVMWGIDNSFLSRALSADIFEPHIASGLDAIPTEFTDLVPNGEATPVDFGDVCVNYDIGAFETNGIAPPQSLADLIAPEYKDLLVVQNPATSSPGLAFLLATIAEFGEDGWKDYWTSLVDNGVAVVDGWTSAYYEQFSYAGGDRPLVVSYGSSPPVEVLFSDTELATAPTGVSEDTCYRQIEFAGVLAGTDAPDEARQLVDFMITPEFQATLPLNVFVFPANGNVELDAAFTDFAVIPDTSRTVEPAAIEANRSDWIDQWTDLVLG